MIKAPAGIDLSLKIYRDFGHFHLPRSTHDQQVVLESMYRFEAVSHTVSARIE